MKRICFIADSLYNSAGTEHSLSVIASSLVSDYKVTVLTAFQKGKPLFYHLNKEVTYNDLGVNDKPGSFFFHNRTMDDFKVKLTDYLKTYPQDYVITVGGFSQFFLYKIKDGSKKIFWFKFEINIYRTWAANKGWFKRNIVSMIQKYRMIYHARKFDRIIVLTDADKEKWDKYTKKAIRIYNPITLEEVPKVSDCSKKEVIAAGRLERVKGFDLLISAWSDVNKNHPDWKLTIFGEGSERRNLEELIDSLNLKDAVNLPGKTKNIIEQYSDSSIFVLSSREEGFGNVLVEAEACGLPIVSFDCPYGPREIVNDKVNGYLVHPDDVKELAYYINLLISNEKLRKEMGRKSIKESKRFSLHAIKEQWNKIIIHK